MNQADECRKRADDCVRAAVCVRDDVLREAYFQLARHWRGMASQAESLEQVEVLKSWPRTSRVCGGR
jgi:hypothetical protein